MIVFDRQTFYWVYASALFPHRTHGRVPLSPLMPSWAHFCPSREACENRDVSAGILTIFGGGGLLPRSGRLRRGRGGGLASIGTWGSRDRDYGLHDMCHDDFAFAQRSSMGVDERLEGGEGLGILGVFLEKPNTQPHPTFPVRIDGDLHDLPDRARSRGGEGDWRASTLVPPSPPR